jgi:hypothetical protein
MLTIIFSYRNRNIKRVKNALNSLNYQTKQDFRVSFVDYGSLKKHALEVEKLVKGYAFVDYTYHATDLQPWNKSKALNSVIKELERGYCFVADIDMIFHPQFVEKICEIKSKGAIYFKVGFLNEKETFTNKKFEDYSIDFYSNSEATGLTLFSVNEIQAIRGFDEFYHFWGAEDTDIHVRLQNSGIDVTYYDKECLLLHQWHTNYRSKETDLVTGNLQIKGIVQINHEYLKKTKINQSIITNSKNWGNIKSNDIFKKLAEYNKTKKTYNFTKAVIDMFLFTELSNLETGIHYFVFKADFFQKRTKNKLKKILGKKVDPIYSVKEVNDKILLHIISFYRDLPYTFQVCLESKELHFKILK